jgi:hypothetical protein
MSQQHASRFTDSLKEYLDSFADAEAYYRMNDRLWEWRLRFGHRVSRDSLAAAGQQEIIAHLEALHNVADRAHRLTDIVQQPDDWQKVQRCFLALADDTQQLDMDERLRRAREEQMGVATMTEFLAFFDPGRYAMKNKRSEGGLEIMTSRPFVDRPYSEFMAFCEDGVTLLWREFAGKFSLDPVWQRLRWDLESMPFLLLDRTLAFFYDRTFGAKQIWEL